MEHTQTKKEKEKKVFFGKRQNSKGGRALLGRARYMPC